MPRALEVAGIAGSLRQGSFNRSLLRAAIEIAPPDLHIVAHEIGALPLYNADVDAAAPPASVIELRNVVRQADALLIATPEYNHGVPGVLKNAIDWLSRPARGSPLDGKPAAIMGASPGMTGSARAQSQLRQAFVFTNTYAMLQPEVLVARAHTKFDSEGWLTDEETRNWMSEFFKHFVEWIRRFVTA